MDEHANTDAEIETNPVGHVSVRRRLGRGLNALLGVGGDEDNLKLQIGPSESIPEESTETSPEQSVEPVLRQPGNDEINVDLIVRNPFQPRKEFQEEALEDLSQSISRHGILQPLLVRPHGESYQLIAGERRLMAARKAGLDVVPCRILEIDDQRVFEAAIEENLKRKDLNVLEKAQAFRDYIDRFESSVEELAKQLSMNRSTVSNYLRLLDLSDFVKESLASERITNGHARALLSLDEESQIELCKRVTAESLSVRKTEEAVRELQNRDESATIPFPMPEQQEEPEQEKPVAPEPSSHILSLQQQLSECLGTKVEIRQTGSDTGKIIIPFSSNDQFEHLIGQLRRAA